MRTLVLSGALALGAGSATAQAPTFDLPPGARPSPPPPVTGPTDPENPFERPRADPTPQPSPIPAPPPTPATSTAPDERRGASQPAPPSRGTTPAPAPSGAAPPPPDINRDDRGGRDLPQAEQQVGQVSVPPRAAQAAGNSAASDVAPPVAPRQRGNDQTQPGGMSWLLVAALAAVLVAGGWLALRLRRRRPARSARPASVRQRPEPAGGPGTTPPTEPPPPPLPLPPSDLQPLTLALEATRMSATLVNAVLGYRLTVTNTGAVALSRLSVTGDMVSAHASRPSSELLGPGDAQLPVLHRIEALAPGESVTVGGEIRLPLQAITPIRRGDAALFVPLARVRVEGATPHGEPTVAQGTFVVGQPAASERLHPFRLDLGPRLYSQVGQQQLATPA